LDENPKRAVEEVEVLPGAGPDVMMVVGTLDRFEATRDDARSQRAPRCARVCCARMWRVCPL